jgi:hypothetical protein
MPPRSRSGNPAVRAAAKKSAAKTKTGTYSLANYRREAGGEPFPLELDDGEVIEIPRPTGDVMMELGEKYGAAQRGDSLPIKEVLQDLLGDHYDTVMPIIGAEDFQVMIKFLEDLSEHFGLGEALASLR